MSKLTLEELLAREPERTCNGCKKLLPITDFHRNRLSKNGRHTWCKWCREKSREVFAKANPEHTKAGQARRTRKYRYGITGEEFNAMVTAQQGLCAICRYPPDGTWPTLLVDHDHKTGKVRALLCRNCNLALGFLRDDPAIHRRVVAYLKGGG